MVFSDCTRALILAHQRANAGDPAIFVDENWFMENGRPLNQELVYRGNILLDVVTAVSTPPSEAFLLAQCTTGGVVDKQKMAMLKKSWGSSLLFLVLSLSYCFAEGIGKRPRNKHVDSINTIRDTEDGPKIAQRMIMFVEFFFSRINPNLSSPIERDEYEDKQIARGYLYVIKQRAKSQGMFSDCWGGAQRRYFGVAGGKKVWLPFLLALSMCVTGVVDKSFLRPALAVRTNDGISPEERDLLESMVSRGGHGSIRLF